MVTEPNSAFYTRTLQFPSGHTNAAAESFFSTLEHEVLSRHHFRTRKEAQQTIVRWVVDFYNRRRRHSSCGMQSPIDYEISAANRAA
jgi:putative transposase